MPQPEHKVFIAQLRKESVAMAAHYERTPAANDTKGVEADIRKAMHLLLPDKQGQMFYLGAFWGLRYAGEILQRAEKRSHAQIVVPGEKQKNAFGQARYSVEKMLGVAAVRAADSKREKGHG